MEPMGLSPKPHFFLQEKEAKSICETTFRGEAKSSINIKEQREKSK